MSDLESNVVVPRSELEARWAKCRRFLPEVAPQAGWHALLFAFADLLPLRLICQRRSMASAGRRA